MNRAYQKSAQVTVNTAPQAYVAAGTPLAILGALVTDTGCAIYANASGLRINAPGLYSISFDVTSTPTAAANQAIQIYRDSVPVADAITTDTTAAASIITQHVSLPAVCVSACPALHPVFSVQISGGAGTATLVRAAAVKLA